MNFKKLPSRGILIMFSFLFLIFSFVFLPAAQAAGVAAKKGPVASVLLAPVKKARISVHATAYGDVVPAPGALEVASVPYEIRVRSVMVSAGQKVSKGDPLITVEPSPDTSLEFEEAKTAYKISRENLGHIKQLFALKLATNTQVLGSREAFEQASLRFKNLEKMGVGGRRVIRSEVDGVVSDVDVQQGSIVADGKPLVGVISKNLLEARLGVEPAVALRLVHGGAVNIRSVNGPPEKVAGRIRKISRAVNPATRLMDVFVSLPPARFLLGEYVKGRIETASSFGLVVPESAVLPESGGENKNVFFTVRNGRAVKHIVSAGPESGGEIEISGGGVKAGDLAVVLGNYELKNGMRVRVEKRERAQ